MGGPGKNKFAFSDRPEYEDFQIVKEIKDEESKLKIQILHSKGKITIQGTEYPLERWGYAYAFEGREGRLSYFQFEYAEKFSALFEAASAYVLDNMKEPTK